MSDNTPTTPTKDPRQITIFGRASYVHVHQPQKPKKGSENKPDGTPKAPRWSVTTLLDKVKRKDQIDKVKAAVKYVAENEAKWAGKQVKLATGKCLCNPDAKDKIILKGICLRDGTEKDDKEGYGDGVMFVTSGTYSKPQVKIKRGGKVVDLEESSKKPYSGCEIAVTLRLWAQDNEGGKMINAEVLAVCFVADGEPLGASAPVNTDEEFGDVPDAEGASTGSTTAAAEDADEEW